jgi:hypothetical protein
VIKNVRTNGSSELMAELQCDICKIDFDRFNCKVLEGQEYHFCSLKCAAVANQKDGLLNKLYGKKQERVDEKPCNRCEEIKSVLDFRLQKNGNRSGICKKCYAVAKRKENKTPEQVERKNAAGRNENLTPEQIEKKNARKRVENLTPEQIEKNRKNSRIANCTPEEIEKRNARQRNENLTPEQIEKRNVAYRVENLTEEQKISRRLKKNKRAKERREQEPAFQIRYNVTSAIRTALRKNGSSKNGQSTWDYMPCTREEIEKHFEFLFSHPNNLTPDGKIWMHWSNWSIFDRKTWNDNDPNTWVWQLDHIVPHSEFKYISMSDQSFKDCWALSNLRPLSAKQNIMDGVNRTRHKKAA